MKTIELYRYMEEQFSKLHDRIDTFEAATKADIGELKENFKMLQIRVDGISADVEILKSNFTLMNKTVAAMQTDVGTMQIAVATMQADITAMQANVTTMQANVTKMQGDIATMQGDVITMQADIEMIKNAITDQVFNAIEILDEKTDSHGVRILRLERRII